MNKLCFIIPFVGIPNKICNLFIKCAKWNKNVDFYIYCDNILLWEETCGKGDNIFYKSFSLNICKSYYEKYCNLYEKDSKSSLITNNNPIEWEMARQLFCGAKPFFQIFFNDVIKNYKYYGWLDYDILTTENFFNDIIDRLENDSGIFNINGKGNQSATFQIFRYNEQFKNIIIDIVNKPNYSILNWLVVNKKLRYYDETIRSPNNSETFGFLKIKLDFIHDNKYKMLFLSPTKTKKYNDLLQEKYILLMNRMKLEQNYDEFKNLYNEISIDNKGIFINNKTVKNSMILIDEYSKCKEFLNWYDINKPITFYKFGKDQSNIKLEDTMFCKKIIMDPKLFYNLIAKQ